MMVVMFGKKNGYCRDPYVYIDFIGWPCPASGTAPGTQVGRYVLTDPFGAFEAFPVDLDSVLNATAFYGTIDDGVCIETLLFVLQEDTSIPGNTILQTVDVNDSITTYSASNC